MTITLTNEEVQQVLGALEAALSDEQPYIVRCKQTVETLRAKLAQPEIQQRTGDCLLSGVCAAEGRRIQKPQPEPEPHGYLWFTRYMEQRFTHRKPEELERIGDVTPVFAAPQKLEWQSLTDEDRQELAAEQHGWEGLCSAVEAKLKEKNT